MKLKDKVVLVTGAGSGIGRAIAVRFAEEGATVAVNDVNLEGAQETVRLMGGRGMAVRANVSKSAEVRAMFEQVDKAYDRLDVLVNNAGIAELSGPKIEELATKAGAAMNEMMAGGPVQTHLDMTVSLSDEEWARMLAVHVNGTFYCTREALLRMNRRNAGAIVNMASIAALMGMAPAPHYGAAKGAIIGFTRSVAQEVATRGIRVNAICPGWIDTPMTSDMSAIPLFAMFIKSRTPMGRFGKAEEIAAAALFLASDDASFVTGQWLSPNGGFFIG